MGKKMANGETEQKNRNGEQEEGQHTCIMHQHTYTQRLQGQHMVTLRSQIRVY